MPSSAWRDMGVNEMVEFTGPTFTCGAEKFATERGISHQTYLSIGFNEEMTQAILISEHFPPQSDRPFGYGQACAFHQSDGAWRATACRPSPTIVFAPPRQPPVKP